MGLDLFSPAARAWFESSFPAPSPAQEQGWPAIAGGEHTLILAPTGSGKTLAAFLWGIDRLASRAAAGDGPAGGRRAGGTSIVYVSPLRALAVDVEKNLRAPIAGIRAAAERLGVGFAEPSVGLRTGDTPADVRRQLVRNPPDILITTPESLYLMVTSQARESLRGVEAVIVDEIHSLVPTKRGAHLALTLERLDDLADSPPQRIGLSATQRPLDVVARFLGGFEDVPRRRGGGGSGDGAPARRPRPCRSSTPASARRSTSRSWSPSTTWATSAGSSTSRCPARRRPGRPAGRSGRRSTPACSSWSRPTAPR